MKLVEISPYIRFAKKINLPWRKMPLICLDCRLFFVTAGSGTVTVNNISYQIEKGTLLFWQPGTAYFFDSEKGVTLMAVNFDLTTTAESNDEILPLYPASESEALYDRIHTVRFSDSTCLNEPIVLRDAADFEESIEKISKEMEVQAPFSAARASAFLKICITQIAQRVMFDRCDTDIQNKVRLITEYIHNNYFRNLNNDSIAQLVGYHPYYLNRIFKKQTGISLHQYITHHRLTVSEQLLLTGQNTVSTIAAEVGFQTTAAYITAFKNKNGVTPSEYRKKCAAYV